MAPSPFRLVLVGGGIVAAGAAAVLRKRPELAEKLPGRLSKATEPAEPAEPAAPVPPQPSNYDAPGPVANTATPLPAPDPHGEQPESIDEAAEEAAAAAEAAAIGGSPSDYAGPELGEPADEAFRPLAEAGQGESEGQEQAEAALADNATYRDAGVSDAERQIDEVIAQADQPLAGETPEPLVSRGGETPVEPDEDPGGPSGSPAGA